MSRSKHLREFITRTGYVVAVIGLCGLVLLEISCSSNNNQANTQVRQENANTTVEIQPQATPQPTPERRYDTTALKLVHVIYRWCDYKEQAYLETGLNLGFAWRRKHPTDPLYYPDGVDILIDKLKQVPDFNEKEQIKHLSSGYFNPDSGIKTAGDLYDFIQFNRNFSADK